MQLGDTGSRHEPVAIVFDCGAMVADKAHFVAKQESNSEDPAGVCVKTGEVKRPGEQFLLRKQGIATTKKKDFTHQLINKLFINKVEDGRTLFSGHSCFKRLATKGIEKRACIADLAVR